jgi:hypothetical protein
MSVDARPSGRAVSALSILRQGGTEIDELLRRTDTLAGSRAQAPQVAYPRWTQALGRVAEAAAQFLDLDVVDVMVAGWRKYDALIDAALRTRDTDLSLPVDLAGTSMLLRQHPWVEITWQGTHIGEVHFIVAVDVHVVALGSTVRRGALVELTTGKVVVTVSLSTLGETTSRETELDPSWVVDLGSGIRLVD